MRWDALEKLSKNLGTGRKRLGLNKKGSNVEGEIIKQLGLVEIFPSVRHGLRFLQT